MMSILRATIDDKIYSEANEILATLGLDMNGAVRMFLQGVVLHNGIPFDLRLTPDQAETMRARRATNRQATQEAREIARTGGPGHASVEAMLEAMQKDEG
jgi:addiction module RelB/DinJ family antitoxin